ncbi:hypothetical protein QZH41_002683 [Actinostola sp. cb2023]|nr:hypothetical protein QZH41_002683 [Actinostola sp. cb2023]
MKPKTEELSGAATGQSRPVSICSSVSSGYASGEEGDNSTPNSTSFTIVCPCNGPTCNAKQQEFSHLVKELRHESALEQLAQQKFDFSVSCISPPLQRLHALRLQRASVIPESETGEIDKDPEDVQDANCTANSDTQSRTQSESKSEGTKTLSNLDKEDVLSDSIEETIDQTMDNFIEDFSNTLNNFENLHLMKVADSDRSYQHVYDTTRRHQTRQVPKPTTNHDDFVSVV